MSELLTLELPDEVAQRAREVAAATNRRVEDAAVEWIRQAVAEPAVESLSDADLLALYDASLDATHQDELSGLLAQLRDGALSERSQPRLDQLTAVYRRGLVRKALTWREAVARGLQSPLGTHAA